MSDGMAPKREFICQKCKREDCLGVLNMIFCNRDKKED